MPKTLNPVNTFPTSIPNFPIAGNDEPMAIGPLEAAIQAVLDRTENLHQSRLTVEGAGIKRIQRVAPLTALQNLAGMSDGDTVDVEGYGRYRLYNPSALTADGLWVLNASGGGRWVHTAYLMRGIKNGWAMLDSGGRLAQDVRDGSILTAHLANGAVTGPKLAAGAAVANIGYTPLNKAGDTMTGLLVVQPNVGEVLSLKGGSSDHAYLGFYARSANQNARSGYIGYGAAGTDVLNIANERPGGLVAVNDTILPTERGTINFNSDWNSYTTPGYYRVADEGSSAANTPPASYRWGVLLVIKSGTAITQLYTQHDGPGTFVRQAWNGNDWQPWVELSPNFKNRFTVSGCVGGTSSGTLSNDNASIRQLIPVQLNDEVLRLVRVRFWGISPTKLRVKNAFTWTSDGTDGEYTPNFALSNPVNGITAVNVELFNDSGSSQTIFPYMSWWLEFEIV